MVPIRSPFLNMTWPWRDRKTKNIICVFNLTHSIHNLGAKNILLCCRRCSISSTVSFRREKRSLVQLNLCTVLSRYWSVGRQRAESRLLHILHLIWLEEAKIDLFIEVNKIIFEPIHLLISLEQHQISIAAWFKCVCSYGVRTNLDWEKASK